MMFRYAHVKLLRTLGFVAALGVLGLLLRVVLAPAAARPQPVQVAWQRAQRAGVYHFATDLVQTTHPAATRANVGLGSHEEMLRVEGDVNLPGRTMQMRLLQNAG